MNSDLILVPHLARDLQAHQFDDEAWSNAPEIAIDHLCSGEMAPASRAATTRLLWTDSALLTRFECRQEEPIVASAQPKLESKTFDLFNRDVCEIFLAPPQETLNLYYEYEAAPRGEWLDLALVRDHENAEWQRDWKWDSGMTTAARMEGEFTIIAMRIPWASLQRAPQAGEEWRANLYRCAGTPQSHLAWRATNTTSFHVPERFGRLRFIK